MISEKSDVETPSLWKDKILWLLLLAYLSIFMTVSALLLLLPLLLEYPNFGLLDSDLKASRERLASATSMAMIPHGVMNLCFSTVGFLIISNKIGDRWTARGLLFSRHSEAFLLQNARDRGHNRHCGALFVWLRLLRGA